MPSANSTPYGSPPPPDAAAEEPSHESEQQMPEQATRNDEQVAAHQPASNANDDSGTIDLAEPLEEFDWDNLLEDYEAKITTLNQKEADIYGDFDKLIKYFGVWAETVQTHELERAWKRINTRQAHVLNSEDELETKRAQYVGIVHAFQHALSLLHKT